MKKLIFVTSPSYFEPALENVRILREICHIEMIVLITPHLRKEGCLEVLQGKLHSSGFYKLEDIYEYNTVNKISKFINIENTKVFYFSSFKGLSIRSIIDGVTFYKYLKSSTPDVVYLDDLLNYTISTALLINNINCRIIANIHDPQSHLGEKNWRRDLIRKLYFKKINTFLTLSTYSKLQFELIYPNLSEKIQTIKLLPYSFYNLFDEYGENVEKEKNILFFGRVSKYKGIENLLIAFNRICRIRTDYTLIIAGKNVAEYELPRDMVDSLKGNVEIKNHYISNQEMIKLLKATTLLVLPYKEASQSGVIMTAISMNTPILATNVGALPEYIEAYMNGYIIENNTVDALEISILNYINNLKALHSTSSQFDYESAKKMNLEVFLNIIE